MQTSTVTVRSSGCGCGCGGMASQTSGAFVRPRFFAGQLLTEDDLQALTGYLTGKDRLRNRLLSGPGVVCGLEVVCDPCGGGTVTVRSGYALDCCGNDIVVGCPERVDVNALVHDLRVRSLGADCGDPCHDAGTATGSRKYGLFIRYAEQPTDPIAPFGIDDSCPPTGCEPSRIRETFRFLVTCDPPKSHRYDPAARLAACLADAEVFSTTRTRAGRLARYRTPMRGAIRAAGSPVLFDDESLARFQNRIELGTLLGGKEPPSGDAARHAVDLVRSVASAVVRYDLYDSAGQAALRDRYPALAEVETARGLLGDAVAKLSPMVTQLWSEPVRALAQAILEETQALVVGHGTVAAPLEARMLAQGTPLSYALRAELTADLARLRDWLLVRLESGVDLTDCATGPIVAGTVLPPGLPTQPPPGREHVGVSELGQAALAADRLDSALLRYVAGCVCASILPPCGDCADGDVLLAVVEVKDCAVVGICATGREQWLPGGPGYAAWAPKLYQARALAERVCCQPVTVAALPDAGSADGPVQLDYVPQLLDHPASTELDILLTLLAPKYGTPAPVDDASSELARLRAQVDQLAATVAGLTAAPPPAESSAEAPPAEPEPTEAEEPEEKRTSPAPRKAAPHKAAAKATPQKRAKPAQSDDQES